MTFLKSCFFILALTATVFCNAIELGEMTFESRYGDPFKAQIDVPNVGNISTDNLRARVAPWATWQSLNINRTSYIDDIEISIVTNRSGKTTILVNSKRRLGEPYLDLLVELRWPSGTLLKHYIVLVPMGIEAQATSVDEPSFSQTETEQPSTQASAESVKTYPQIDRNEPITVSKVESRVSSTPEYNHIYITKENETLESIAIKLGHPQLRVDEIADTLFDYNFYVASRNRVLPSRVSIEIPEQTAFKSKTSSTITFSDEVDTEIDVIAVENIEVAEPKVSTEVKPKVLPAPSAIPAIDISQVIRPVPGVESSIARFTPTERAEARIRALGFANAQQRIEGTVPNQVIAAAGMKTVLDRLVEEQGLSPSAESTLEVVALAEGVRRMDESILEYRSRLYELESRTELHSKTLENLSYEQSANFNSENYFGGGSEVNLKSGWRIFWTTLVILLALLFLCSLVFIWCLFRHPDILIKLGLPIMGDFSSSGVSEEQFQGEDESSSDQSLAIPPLQNSNSSEVISNSSESETATENKEIDGYNHFFNEGNAYSTPDASLLNAKKHLGVVEQVEASPEKDENDQQKYARPMTPDESSEEGIDFEGSLQTIVLDLDKTDLVKEAGLEKVFSERDSEIERENSNHLDHLQDDLETFDFMEEDIDDIDLTEELSPVDRSFDDEFTVETSLEKDLMSLSNPSLTIERSEVEKKPDLPESRELELRTLDSSDTPSSQPVGDKKRQEEHSFNIDPAKVNESAIAGELADFTLATQSLEVSKKFDLVDENATDDDSISKNLEGKLGDDNQDDLFANIAMFELLDNEQDDFQFEEDGDNQLIQGKTDFLEEPSISLNDEAATERVIQTEDAVLIRSEPNLSTFEKLSPMDVLALIDTKIRLEPSHDEHACFFYFEIDNFEKFESKFGILPAETLSLSVLEEMWEYVSKNISALMLNRFRQKSFVLISPNISEGEAVSFAGSMIDDLQARPIEVENETHFFSVSAAVIPVNDMFESGSSAIASAQNLVSQIQNHKDQEPGVNVRLYQPNFNESLSNAALVSVGRRLLQSDSFNAVYRPIIGLKTDSSMYLFESQLKLDTALMDAEYPVDLLERLYNSDLALELDNHLLSSSCVQLDIRSRDTNQAKVVLNFSIRTLTKADFVEWFIDIVSGFDISPSRFVIQVDELSASRQMIKLSDLRKKLVEIDVQISMSQICFDHIPMKTLELLKLDYAKLHVMLSQHVQNTGNRRADIEAHDLALETLEEMIESAKKVATSVIVPGVEQAKLLPKLWRLGVNFIEGNYVASESSNMQPPKSFLSGKGD